MAAVLAIPNNLQTANAATSGRYFDNIVFVAMENQNYADVMGDGHGSPNAPFIASLLPQGATIPNYQGNPCGGSSENSYIALISGDTWGCPGNGTRDIGDASTKTLVDLFEGAGLTWQAYCEASCGRDGDHFPWIDFVSITSSSERMSHVDTSASTSNLVNAVGSYNFLWFTPEDNHNMHDNSVSSGDSYLSGFVPDILSKPGFTNGRSLLMLWWDEYEPAPFLIVGPTVVRGLISSRNDVGVYTITKLIEENWGMPSLTSNDASEASMSEFFGTSQPTPGQLTASFTSAPNVPLIGQTVTFAGSATGGSTGYSFSWNFGDGAVASGNIVTHAYLSEGSYSASLTVQDSGGQSATTSKTITVTTANPVPGQPGMVCVVLAGAASCPSGAPTINVRTWNTVTVSVIIQGSDMINGFDITVQTDPAFIQPQSATLEGTILSNPFVLLNQVNQTAGTVTVAAVSISGEVLGNGLLFSIYYQAIARTNGSSISLTSVTVTNGASTPVTMITQDGQFQVRGPRRKH